MDVRSREEERETKFNILCKCLIEKQKLETEDKTTYSKSFIKERCRDEIGLGLEERAITPFQENQEAGSINLKGKDMGLKMRNKVVF